MREELYYGSLYAGIVLSACGTAFPHPLGYVLTEDFSIPHGRACTAFCRHSWSVESSLKQNARRSIISFWALILGNCAASWRG